MSTEVAPVEVDRDLPGPRARRVAVLFDPSADTAGIAAELATRAQGRRRGRAGRAVPGRRWRGARARGGPPPGPGPGPGRGGRRPPLAHLPGHVRARGRPGGPGHGPGPARAGPVTGPASPTWPPRPGFVPAAGVPAARAAGPAGCRRPPAARRAADTAAYQATFGATTGTWGAFAYDSAGAVGGGRHPGRPVYGPSVHDDLAHLGLPGGHRPDHVPARHREPQGPAGGHHVITAKGSTDQPAVGRAVGYTF